MKRYDFPKTDGKTLGYTVFLPETFSKDTAYPLILSLHGAGERGNGADELEKATDIGLGKYIKLGQMSLNAIVLCPQCPKDRVWNQLIFDTRELLLKIADEYGADKKKISVTGMSMGGFGTWEMGMQFPELFSALAPICGGGMAWRTPALKGKPIWAFHGDADNVVAISTSMDMVNGARKNGADVKFTIFNNVMHNSWDPAYLETKVIDWLISKSI
ncbi:MAG: dienelactone hydrolase family protein [Clostridia bacterium]|nr:dienelactone hydrolase family protein [Clostridia bacterium]